MKALGCQPYCLIVPLDIRATRRFMLRLQAVMDTEAMIAVPNPLVLVAGTVARVAEWRPRARRVGCSSGMFAYRRRCCRVERRADRKTGKGMGDGRIIAQRIEDHDPFHNR